MPGSGRRWIERGGVVAVLALAVLLALPGLVAGERLFLRDTVLYFWPTKAFLADRLRAGELPLWLPAASSGQPFLANPKNSLLYPPQALYLWLEPGTAFHALIAAHLLWLGLGAYLWLRRARNASTLAAGAGSAALLLSGFVLASVEFHQHIFALAWLPWSLCLALPGPDAGRRRRQVVLAMALALLLLAGEPYIAVLGVLLLMAQALLGGGDRRRTLRNLALSGTAAVALAAPQLVPAALHLGSTARIAASYWRQADPGLPLRRLPELALPHLFGRPDRLDNWAVQALGHAPLYVAIYPGAIVLLALLLALGRPRQGPAGGLALVALLVAATPLGERLAAVPPLSLIRYQAKYLLLLALAGPVALAGLVDRLAAGERAAARRLCWLGAVAAAIGSAALLARGWWSPAVAAVAARAVGRDSAAALGWLAEDLARLVGLGVIAFLGGWLVVGGRHRLGAIVVATAALLDLASVAAPINPTFPGEAVSDPGPLLAAAVAHRPAGRLWRDPAAASSRIAHADLSAWWEGQRSLRTGYCLAGLPFGLRYAFDRDYDDFYVGSVGRALAAVADRDGLRRLLELQGVTLILAEQPPFAGVDRLIADGFTGVSLYALRAPLPIVRAVATARVVAGERERLALALAPDLDPRTETVVEAPLVAEAERSEAAPRPSPRPGSGATGAGGGREAEGVDAVLTPLGERANRMEVGTVSPGAFWLVWATTPAAGWRATVDGSAVAVHRADANAMAVRVPAGSHRVVFTYRPPGLVAGLLLALAAMLGLALAWFRPARSDGRAGPEGGRMRSPQVDLRDAHEAGRRT